jgi:hypothetical protein
MPPPAAYKIANPSGDLTVIERSNRMIVKNADMKLTVKDSDVAIYESKEWQIGRSKRVISLMENKGLHTRRCPSYLLISAPCLIKVFCF